VETVGKALLALALLTAVVGGTLVLLAHFGMNRLPGDVVIRRKNVTVYMPLGLMIVVSVLLTVLLNLFWRR
jgi:multisubunit Na+/H+ antiporter MnhG subunit